jgi:hypothetical protein
MIRIFTVVAAATALIALPASAQSIHISTVGKTPEQLHGEIVKAAWKVCAVATINETFRTDAMSRCARDTIKVTLAQVPALAEIQATKVAQR